MALRLKDTMSAYYETEALRASAFRNAILEIYGINLQAASVADTDYRTDGHLIEGFFSCVISECKKEFGSTDADPFVEAGLYYRQLIRKRLTATPHSPLPCLVIYYVGMWHFVTSYSNSVPSSIFRSLSWICGHRFTGNLCPF